MKNFKTQRGITLIALVIIIIVLLILARHNN
jgi:Tfp pilus assembly protein PilE